jgi:hypothetical protein
LQWRLLRIQTEVNWLFLNLNAEVVPGFNLEAEKVGAGANRVLGANMHVNNQPGDFLYKGSFYLGLIISFISVFCSVYLLRRLKAVELKS